MVRNGSISMSNQLCSDVDDTIHGPTEGQILPVISVNISDIEGNNLDGWQIE